MNPMSYKEASALVDKGLLSEEALVTGIYAGIISPEIEDYIPDQKEKIRRLLKEIKPLNPIEFTSPKEGG